MPASPKEPTKRQKIRKTLILISFLLFPVTIYYFSPAVIIGGARQGIINGSFIMFGLLFVVSLVLGRGFCGWACPGGGLGEACMTARDQAAPNGRWNWIKYFLWVPWIGVIITLAVLAGGYHTVDPFMMTWHGISVHDSESYIVYFSFVTLIAVLDWFPGRRGFCHYVCWMAPFMVIGTWLGNRAGIAALHLQADPDACLDCRTCAGNCPMSLDIPALVRSGSMQHSECILCGTCVDNCPAGVIKFAWQRK